jgi:hypothetical protein
LLFQRQLGNAGSADVPRLLRRLLIGTTLLAAASLSVAAYVGGALEAEQQDLARAIARHRAALRVRGPKADRSAGAARRYRRTCRLAISRRRHHHGSRCRAGAGMTPLLATLFAAPMAALALPINAPDLDTPSQMDAPSVPSVWEQPAPAPVIVLRPLEAQPSAPQRTPSSNPLWEIPLSSLSVTRERPIFSPTRRPPPPAAAAVPKPVAAPAKPPPDEPELSSVAVAAPRDRAESLPAQQALESPWRVDRRR